jgi:hypothetical protein
MRWPDAALDLGGLVELWLLTADRGGRAEEAKLQINLSLPLPPLLLGL